VEYLTYFSKKIYSIMATLIYYIHNYNTKIKPNKT